MAFEQQPEDTTRIRIANWSTTLEQLQTEGLISADEARELISLIPEQIHSLTYLLANMGGHLTISMARYTVFPVPIPGVGGLLRLTWTVSNRLYFTLRRRFDRARFHSAPVMVITLIPFAGILSYLYEVKRLDSRLVYLAGEQFSRHHHKKPLQELMSHWPRWLQTKVGRLMNAPFAKESR